MRGGLVKCPRFISAVGEEPFLATGPVPRLVGVLRPAPLARTRHGQEGPGPRALPLVSFFGVVSLGSFIAAIFPGQ